MVPCMELYGHLHDLFRVERYSSLAILPHGTEFDPRKPEVGALLANWIDQLADLFPSPFFHIGMDETHEAPALIDTFIFSEETLPKGASRDNIKVEGQAGYALMKMGLYMAREAGYISEYDTVVGEKLAHVLSGGRLTGEQLVSEQYLLDLEREAFLSLCGNAQTQARMQHMLKTGKPLRN